MCSLSASVSVRSAPDDGLPVCPRGVGWGLGSERRGEVRCSYIFSNYLQKRWQRRVLFSFAKLKMRNGEPSLIFVLFTHKQTGFARKYWSILNTIYIILTTDTVPSILTEDQHIGQPVNLFFLCFIQWLSRHLSAVWWIMLVSVNQPVAWWFMLNSYRTLGVITKKVMAKVTQNSLADS